MACPFESPRRAEVRTPEVKLGIIPGGRNTASATAGRQGTCAELILSGEIISAQGPIDRAANESFRPI